MDSNRKNLHRRFFPNLLYSTQPFSPNEVEMYTDVTRVVFDRIPNFKKLYCDPVVIFHASANLVNSASFGSDCCCIHIDAEFLRLADQMANYAINSFNGNNNVGHLDEIADRVIFHSIMRTGSYNLLHSLPDIKPLNPINQMKAMAQMGVGYLLMHEAAHLGMIKDSSTFRVFKEGFDLDEVELMIDSLRWKQYDYGIFFSQLFKSQSKYDHSISFNAIKNAPDQLLTEIFCDQIALISTVAITQISMISIGKIIRSIAIMQCLTVLLHMTERMIHYNQPYTEKDGLNMFHISLRETVFNSWQLNFFLTFAKMEYETKKFITTMIFEILDVKFALFDSLIRAVGARLKNYINTESDTKPANVRERLGELGYKFNYENYLIHYSDPQIK